MSETPIKYPTPERALYEEAMTCRCCGHMVPVSEGAELLGVYRRTLFRWLAGEGVSKRLDAHLRGWLTARLPK